MVSVDLPKGSAGCVAVSAVAAGNDPNFLAFFGAGRAAGAWDLWRVSNGGFFAAPSSALTGHDTMPSCECKGSKTGGASEGSGNSSSAGTISKCGGCRRTGAIVAALVQVFRDRNAKKYVRRAASGE